MHSLIMTTCGRVVGGWGGGCTLSGHTCFEKQLSLLRTAYGGAVGGAVAVPLRVALLLKRSFPFNGSPAVGWWF